MGGARATNRVREIRKAIKLTQEELAHRVGEETSIATISRLESGRMTLTLPWMKRLGEALGVAPHELIAGNEGQGLKMVPVVSMNSATNWKEAIREAEAYIPALDRVGGPRCFAIRPHESSQGPLLAGSEDGYAIIDPDQTDLLEGKTYLIRNAAHEAVFKTYLPDPPRLVPAPYPEDPERGPIPIGAEPFTVIGRVTYIGREL